MSIVNTALQNIRAKGNLDKYENRASRYGAWELFKQQMSDATPLLSQEQIDRFWSSIGRTFQIPVFDKEDITISSGVARSLTITDAENTTQLVTVTPVTLSWGFTMYPTLYHNNEFGYMADFEKKMTRSLNALGVTLDTMAVTALTSGKSRVVNQSLGYTWNTSLEQIEASLAQKDTLLGALDAMMQANDYYDQLYVVGGMGLKDHVFNLMKYGNYNEVNKTLEYLGKKMMFTNRIVPGSGESYNGFIVNAGSLGVLTRVDREALYGTKSRTGREWGVETLPGFNIPVGTMYYESDVDASSVAGAASADMTASHKQHFGFSLDIAFVTPYNSHDGGTAAYYDATHTYAADDLCISGTTVYKSLVSSNVGNAVTDTTKWQAVDTVNPASILKFAAKTV